MEPEILGFTPAEVVRLTSMAVPVSYTYGKVSTDRSVMLHRLIVASGLDHTGGLRLPSTTWTRGGRIYIEGGGVYADVITQDRLHLPVWNLVLGATLLTDAPILLSEALGL